jgi:hypothetical protein
VVTTTWSSSRNVNSAADSSLAFCAGDPQFLRVEAEPDDVHGHGRLALFQRGGDRARIGVARLEAVGHEDDRVPDGVRRRWEVAPGALERQADRRPSHRCVIGDLLAQGGFVDPVDRHREL